MVSRVGLQKFVTCEDLSGLSLTLLKILKVLLLHHILKPEHLQTMLIFCHTFYAFILFSNLLCSFVLQWLDHSHWYDRKDTSKLELMDMVGSLCSLQTMLLAR